MNVILALLRVGCEGDMSSSIRCYKAEVVLPCAALHLSKCSGCSAARAAARGFAGAPAL
jgi:hypothetical protein